LNLSTYFQKATLLSFLLVVSTGCSSLFAQLNWGFKIGGTTSDFYTNAPTTVNAFDLPTLGLIAGLNGFLRFSPGALLQTEVNFSWNSNQGHFFQQQNIDIFNLNLPLFFKGHFYKNFFAGGGFDFNYFLNLNTKQLTQTNRPWHLSFLFHIERVYMHKFAVSFRYIQSITPIKIIQVQSTQGLPLQKISSYQPRTLQVTFSYFLNTIKFKDRK
jgi:hypothetical protein